MNPPTPDNKSLGLTLPEIQVLAQPDLLLEDGKNSGFNERLKTVYHTGKRAIESSIMLMEVTPLNESLRYAAFTASQVAWGGPVSGAIALGGTNLVIESLAAVAAADWLSNKPEQSRVKDGWMRKALDWTEAKVDKVVPREGKMNRAMEAGIAFLGGTAVLQWAKDRQEPTMNRREKSAYGLRWAGAMSGVVAVQGFFGGDAIHSPAPKTIGLALFAFGGLPMLMNKLKNRSNLKTDENK